MRAKYKSQDRVLLRLFKSDVEVIITCGAMAYYPGLHNADDRLMYMYQITPVRDYLITPWWASTSWPERIFKDIEHAK